MTSRPLLTITFDDNSDTIYDEAFTYMQTLGLKGSHALITATLGQAGLLTLAQVQEMNDAGWGIINHTKNHNNLTGRTDQQVVDEITTAQTYMEANGLGSGKEVFVPPENGVTDRERNLMSPYIKCCTSETQATNNFPLLDKYKLDRKGVGSNTPATIKGWIDDAITNTEYLHLNFHRIEEPKGALLFPPSEFQEVMDYVKLKVDTGAIELVTMVDLANELNTSQTEIKGTVTIN